MRIITEPTVYIVGRQTVDQGELSRYLEDHDFAGWSTDSPSDGETLVSIGARLCYQSFKGGRKHADHIRHLLEVGHGSCAEHAVWSLVVTGVSRALSHELVRHRTMSPSQLSQRYVDESVAEYVEPAIIAADEELHALWQTAVAQSHAAYCQIADRLAAKMTGNPDMTPTERRKAARQAARSVLPNATETKLFLTVNARSLRATIEQRCSRHADTEIRILFGRIWEVMAGEAPNLFSDYTRVELPDGTFELTTEFRKV